MSFEVEKQSEFKVEQLAPQDIDKAAEQTGHSNPDIRATWARQAENGELVMFAVKDDDEYIGSVHLLLTGAPNQDVRDASESAPMLNALGVNEDYRQHGLGTKLIEACEDYVRDRSDLPQKIALGVETDNLTARNIYLHRGYKDKRVAGSDMYNTSWPEIDENGNEQMYHATCYLMVKDL